MSESVATGDAIEALDAIRTTHVALALWNRPAPAFADAIEQEMVDNLSLVLADPREDDTSAVMAALLSAHHSPETAPALAADIALLATTHRRLAGATAIKVRLDVIETDACRRFHADYVTLRTLCTYRGAGTQWCRADAPTTIRALATGAVGMFKGRLTMEEPTILHRSPPLRTSRGRRLLLVIDGG